MATIMRVGGGAGGGGSEKPLLPKGYIQLRYIKSTGTQYINTNFAPTSEEFRIVIDFEYTDSNSTSCLFGSQSSGEYSLVAYGPPQFYVGGSIGLLPKNISQNTQYNLDCYTKNNVLYTVWDNVTSSASYSGKLYKDGALYLFANNNQGSVGNHAYAKVYSCQLYDNGVLVRNFIPCRNNYGVTGMYDTVNNKFYKNGGTGEFVDGPAVSKEPIVGGLETGDIIRITENGIPTEYYVAKHGYEPELNGANRTLLVRKVCHSKGIFDSNGKNAYAESTIDDWLNGDFFNSLSDGVRDLARTTKFKYTIGNGNYSVSTLERAVFLLAVSEYGITSSYTNNEGSVIPIVGKLWSGTLADGTSLPQMTRSPSSQGASKVSVINSNGTANDTSYWATSELSIRPVFTIPSDAKVIGPDNYGRYSLECEYGTPDTVTASTYPKVGVTYTDGISDLDEVTLNAIAYKISSNDKITNTTSVVYYDSGELHRKISIGDTINIAVGSTTYPAQIIGFNHDTLVGGEGYGEITATWKAGFTFQLVNCLNTAYKMNNSDTNSGGWESSLMRTSHLASVLGQLSDTMKDYVKTVNKPTSNGYNGGTTTIINSADKLFLLSESEVFPTGGQAFAGEGTHYAWYKAGNSMVKTVNGSKLFWWLRSSWAGGTARFIGVPAQGTSTAATNATTAAGASFAFCI